jgi:hypothetical protein
MRTRYLLPFFLSFLIGVVSFLLWAKRKEVEKLGVVSPIWEIRQQEEKSEKTKEKSGGPTGTTPTAEIIPPVENTPSTDMGNEELLSSSRRVLPPPTDPNYQPSPESPKKTVEAFLKAANEGTLENFQYFLSFEARNNPKIHFAPEGWSGQVGEAVIGEETRGDAGTIKIVVTFYKGNKNEGIILEKIGYFLVKSFGKWLIFDTVIEKQ